MIQYFSQYREVITCTRYEQLLKTKKSRKLIACIVL